MKNTDLAKAQGANIFRGSCDGVPDEIVMTAPQLDAYSQALIQQAAGAVPEGWMRDEKQVRELLSHLVNTGWAQTEDGAECVDQGSAMAAEVVEKILLPMLAASPSPLGREAGSSDHLAACAGGGAKAPWPDFLGQPIRHGDRLVHPANGDEFVAVRLSGHAVETDAWRAVYDDATVSRLCLQIGEKGRAVIAHAPGPDAPTSQINNPDPATGVTKGSNV